MEELTASDLENLLNYFLSEADGIPELRVRSEKEKELFPPSLSKASL